METKTLREWFDELPKDVAEKAIKNTIELTGKDRLRFKVASLKEALSDAFIWAKSIEGLFYWYEIYISL